MEAGKVRQSVSRGPLRRWLGGVTRRIASRVRPKKIILFGSYAYGKPRRDSDLDLLVIASGLKSREKSYDLVDRAVGDHLWPVDLLVRRPEEVEARLRMGDSFFMEIMSKGKVLYES